MIRKVLLILLVIYGVVNSTWGFKESKSYHYEKGVVSEESPCPGHYCGRTKLENGSYSACGACERGLRRNKNSTCEECKDEPEFYDALYLGFMGLLPLTLHLRYIDLVTYLSTFTKKAMIQYTSAIVEVTVAAVVTLLVTEPYGSFNIRSCRVRRLADWYPLLYNPNPNYEGVLHCTQEAVYPLYSMVFVFYTLCLLAMVIMRSIVPSILRIARTENEVPFNAALYFLPALIVIHAIAAGLIYYSFPYMIIILSVISSAAHFAFQLDQSAYRLIVGCVKDFRNLIILLGHWALHAYGIIAVIELNHNTLYISYCAMVPLPAFFYIITSRFTDPANIN